MINVRVEYVLDKKIEDVFTAISDHENYYRFPGFTDSLLARLMERTASRAFLGVLKYIEKH